MKVIAKGDFGWHQTYGEIVQGREYEIAPEDFGDQLFEPVPEPPAATAARKKEVVNA